MRFSTVATTVIAVAPFATAHEGHVPGIVGLNVEDVRARNLIGNWNQLMHGANHHGHQKDMLKPRADDRECGEGIGSCPDDKCCSSAGYCGTSVQHCYSPGCQWEYGPMCAENHPPKGDDTSKFERNLAGKVPYGGAGLYNCVENNTVAITYDDGPQQKYTSHILDLFKKYDAKGTFFVTGNSIGKGQIDTTDEFVEDIKRMDAEGHQIASHTWTHQDLSKISPKDRHNQMVYNEMAINNIVNKIPTYMRPPYSSCTTESGCEKDMLDLGYHVTYFLVDTDDYHQKTAEGPKEWFKGNITKAGDTEVPHIAIAHDIIEHTAMDLTEYMLKTLKELGYKAVTVGECLGDPKGNWYRTANGTGYVAESEYPQIDKPYPNVTPSGGYPTITPTGTASESGVAPTGSGATTPADSPGAASAVDFSRTLIISMAALLLPVWFAFA